MKRKILENEAQREIIAKICGEVDPELRKIMDKFAKRMIVSKKNHLAYCPIAKIGTTAMAFFFIRTGKIPASLFPPHKL